MYGPVGMGVGIAVIFADLGLSNSSVSPVGMALCANSYYSCQLMPVYSRFMYGRFLRPWQISLSVCLFSPPNSRCTAVF